jgi:O-antigen/teichoic acid export membrane protein
MALAGLAWFPVMLTSPVLLALGANRDRMLADLLGRSGSAVVLCSAASFGIMAMAASKLLTLPFQMVLSLCFVRRHVSFRWAELCGALWRSAVVTTAAVAGPIGVVSLSGHGFELPAGATILAVFLAGCGWLAGVLVTQHPILLEIRRIARVIGEGTLVRRLRARLASHGAHTQEAR